MRNVREKAPDKNKGDIHPAARFITRLFKNDMIELIVDGKPEIKRVGGFSTTNNQIDLRAQYETKGKRHFISIDSLRTSFRQRLRFTEDGVRKDSYGHPGC